MEAFETFEHAGLTVELHYDDHPSNPREIGEELGTMVCWHPDYILGDYQVTSPDGRGAVGERFDRDDFPDLRTLERYLRSALGAVVVLPLFLLDHSGISIRAGSASAADPGEWDTTMVGFIFTTAERIRELCGEPQIPSDPFYCPRTWPEDGRSGPNWAGTAEEWIVKALRGEISTYDDYLTGNVAGFVVTDERGDVLDSCWGFYPDDDGDGLDYLRAEARGAAEGERAERAAKRRETVRGWAIAHRLPAGAL